MIKKILQYLREQIKLKDICIWFAMSFIVVFIVFLFVMKRSLNITLLIETLGFAVIFVFMMIGTMLMVALWMIFIRIVLMSMKESMVIGGKNRLFDLYDGE